MLVVFGRNDVDMKRSGGMQIRLDLLKQNLLLSMVGAATGVCFPIGFSYLILYFGYGYGQSAFLPKRPFPRLTA